MSWVIAMNVLLTAACECKVPERHRSATGEATSSLPGATTSGTVSATLEYYEWTIGPYSPEPQSAKPGQIAVTLASRTGGLQLRLWDLEPGETLGARPAREQRASICACPRPYAPFVATTDGEAPFMRCLDRAADSPQPIDEPCFALDGVIDVRALSAYCAHDCAYTVDIGATVSADGFSARLDLKANDVLVDGDTCPTAQGGGP